MANEIHWGKDGFVSARMRPMGEVTYDSMLALPEGTEVLLIFVNPMPFAPQPITLFQFEMNGENSAKVRDMQAKNSRLPDHVHYLLPEITVPDPEAFFAADPRKDADK